MRKFFASSGSWLFILVSITTVYFYGKTFFKNNRSYGLNKHETYINKLGNEEIRSFENFVFSPEAQHRTDAIIIARNNEILYEAYGNGYRPQKLHRLWSLSKLILNLFSGHLIQEGKLSLKTPVKKYFPLLQEGHGKKIVLEDLLRMSSGLDYFSVLTEEMTGLGVYRLHHLTAEEINHPERTSILAVPVYPPGEHFNYSVLDNNLVASIIHKELDKLGGYGYARKILREIGALKTRFDLNNNQKFQFYAEGFQDVLSPLNFRLHYVLRDQTNLWSTPRDILVIASLYLNQGKSLNGKSIFQEDWPLFSWKVSDSQLLYKNEPDNYNRQSFGALWWLNQRLPVNKELEYPSIPQSSAMLKGLHGQTLAIFPQENIIFIRFSNDPVDNIIDRDKMLALALKAVKMSSLKK